MAKRWKPVLGYDCYQVSDDGQVARVKTYGNKPKPVWKMVAQRPKRGGYITYHLCENGERKDLLAHRLVWEAFNGKIGIGVEINHKNGDKSDNRLVNIELLTRSENMKHKFRVLHHAAPNNPSHGSKNASAKLTEADIPKILEMHRAGVYQYEIARIFGVTQRAIGRIVLGQGWQHLTTKITRK
jgi:hypothetical protein